MKFLVRQEVDQIQFYRLKKGSRPMILIGGRLYRCEDRKFIEDKSTSQAILVYNIDGIQPLSSRGEKMDPDLTKAYIDSAKLGGTKKRNWVVELNNMSDALMGILAAVIVGGVFLMYVIGQVL